MSREIHRRISQGDERVVLRQPDRLVPGELLESDGETARAVRRQQHGEDRCVGLQARVVLEPRDLARLAVVEQVLPD